MIRTLPLAEQKKLERNSEVAFTVKPGWELMPWNPTPFTATYRSGTKVLPIFKFYLQYYSDMIMFTNISLADELKDCEDPALADGYAKILVSNLKTYALSLRKRVICADTKLSFFVDHFIDKGFSVESSPEVICDDSKSERTYRFRIAQEASWLNH